MVINFTPPTGWHRCTENECVMYPRWAINPESEHWHKPTGQCLTVDLDYEPLPAEVHMRLRALIEAQNSAEDMIDDSHCRGRLQGYVMCLCDVGTISNNHPLFILTR